MNKHTLSTAIDPAERLRRQQATSAWFAELRDRICGEFEDIEDEYAARHPDATAGRFEQTQWRRQGDEEGDNGSGGDNGSDGGGGTMAMMHGLVFEKVGVNISTVEGSFSDAFRGEIPGTKKDPNFWASGISLVAHMRNPFVPAVHMNTRYLNTGGIEGKRWFGGGADLTPIMPFDEDSADFHQALRRVCDEYSPSCYERYKKWCDEYFYLEHRKEARGAGGIFYDYLDEGDFEREFAFMRGVGLGFLDIYLELVRRRVDTPFTDADRHHQLVRRGRYVEFNLLYDRGTAFGLKTGGNVEAILMSLPPEVRWP